MLLYQVFQGCGLDKELKRHKNFEILNVLHAHEHCDDKTAYFCFAQNYQTAFDKCQFAVENGAKIVVSNFNLPLKECVVTEDCRSVFANCCANFYHHACDKLKIVGITGTNGKTTTSHIIGEMLKRNGKKVGVIGTSGVFYDGKTLPSPLTTPDADFLHKTFFDMQACGIEYVIMEVSAHAIDQKRIDGIKFELGVLTNITQDHLDYFKTFDAYKEAKLEFLTQKHVKKAIVCVDDENAQSFLQSSQVPTITYGINNPSDVFGIDICCSMNGSHFVANVVDSVIEIKTNLIGRYNVENCLAALTVCRELGLDDKQLSTGLNFINPVEGRFNVINIDGKYVIVDFAHSPDSLMNVLKTAKSLTDKKVFVVFGCGGNRDRTKRWQMGEIAEKYADYVCLTDDNPRTEKSLDIIADIEKGMKRPHAVEPDRYLAIKKMIDFAQAGDIVLIAGKGAEKYQEIGTEKRPYNDFESVYKYFQDLKTRPTCQKGRDDYGC